MDQEPIGWTSEELAHKLTVALGLPIDFRGIAEAINCLPEDDQRRSYLRSLFDKASALLADSADRAELDHVERQIMEALIKLLQ